MEASRVRRLGGAWEMESRRRRRRGRAVLPVRSDRTNSTGRSQCCYLDYKIRALNQPLFRLGTRFAAFLRPWFSLGLGFALASLLSVCLLLLSQLAAALRILPRTSAADLSASLLFGFSPVSAFGASLSDSGYLLVSTLISVGFHEFGHALAAASLMIPETEVIAVLVLAEQIIKNADVNFHVGMIIPGTVSMGGSEGIQMDYLAVFLVFLFPGALVAFNYDALQALSPFASLRVYCAGIWHNAVCCAVCGLVLFLLPLLLFPFYQQGESPMVLSVPSSSPLSPYLSPGDVIVSLDGIRISSPKEWREMAVLLNQVALESTNNDTHPQGVRRISNRKGFCVPDSVLEESKQITVVANQSGCADDLASFVTAPCSTSMFDYGRPKRVEHTHCLNPQEVVKFAKCSDNWLTAKVEGDSCRCSQDESCLSPIQTPGMIWVEVSYSNPNSPKCLQSGSKPLSDLRTTNDSVEPDCGGTFVFVGDLISMASFVQLTSFRPRGAYASPWFPYVLEKFFICTFHVSLTLALLNSLPVYFLDGESILEETISHFTSLSPNKREKLLQICLLVGTLVSLLSFIRIVLRFL